MFPHNFLSTLIFFSISLSGFIKEMYASIVSRFTAWTSVCTSLCSITRFLYSSVPPCCFGILWWQWISSIHNTFPVTAHLPYCAVYTESRLSIYSILRLHTVVLDNICITVITSSLNFRFWCISCLPFSVYLHTVPFWWWAFLVLIYPIGHNGKPIIYRTCLLLP